MSYGQCVVVAILTGTVAGVSTSIAAASALALAIAAMSVRVWAGGRQTGRLSLLWGLMSFAAAHAAHGRDRALQPPLVTLLDRGQSGRPVPATFEGVLARDAEASDAGVRLVVKVRRVDVGAGPVSTQGRVQLTVSGELAGPSQHGWVRGRAIRAPALLREPPVSLNPGLPGERWQRITRRVDMVGTVKSAMLVEVQPGTPWDEMSARIRAAVRSRAAFLYRPRSRTTEAIVNAILIGDRSGLDPAIEERLQIAGTYHVVAISGGNVALVTVLCLFALRTLVRPFRLVLLTSAIAVLVYGWIVGGDPSVVRAVSVAALYLLLSLRGLAPAPINVLGAVAVFIVCVDPLSVVDVGAWLSFGATFGIILIAPRLMLIWCPMPAHPQDALGTRVTRAVLALFSATIAAELCLLPVNATVFSRVGAAGLVLNFAAIPTMAVVQIAGAASLVFAEWWPLCASAASALTHAAATALVESARLVEWVPWLSWRVPPAPAAAIVCFYAALTLCLSWSGDRRGRVAALSALAVAAAAIVVAPWTWLALPPAGHLRVTMLDVGQGESILIQFPTGQALLVDAGGRTGTFDVGRRIVTPALWASGARRLDWIAVTHADLDHIGGAASVAAAFVPMELWEGVPVPRDINRQRLYEQTRSRGAVWRELRRGDRFEVGPVLVEVLNPPIPDWERQRPRNPDSIVFAVRYGDVQFLLTGDLDEETERALTLDRPPLLRILKVAHHGSRTSTSPDLLRQLSPQLALVSAGRGNAFGHPAPDVVNRLIAAGVELFRTDRDGATILETDGRAVEVRSMSGRTWTLEVSRVVL